MTEILLGVSAFASVIAALFAIFAAFRRMADPAETVRGEAERARTEAGEQARSLRSELGERLDRFQDNLALRLQSGLEGLRVPVSEIARKLDEDIARLGREAGEGREALRLGVESKLEASDRRSAEAARHLREELTGNFAKSSEQLSATLKELGAHQNERLAKLTGEIALLSEKQAAAAEALRQSVEGRLDQLRSENAAKLDQMRQTVDEKLQSTLEARLGESFRTVSEQLKAVHQGLGEMQSLASGVGDLKKALTNVTTRGATGEVLLENHLSDFLTPDQYIRQAQCREGSGERVDFAIRIRGLEDDYEVLLPIDSKFPKEDYDRLLAAVDAGDAEAMEKAVAALETRVKGFAKSISEKYINPPLTTDFAVLFLPTESLFAEMLRRPGFFEALQRDYRVTLAGPTTLASMLNAFRMGFRSLAIQKRSGEVWKLLGAVRKEFESHGAVVSQLKKQLNAASNTIDKLGTRTNVMSRKLREVEVLPGGASQELLGLTSPDAADDGAGDEEAEE